MADSTILSKDVENYIRWFLSTNTGLIVLKDKLNINQKATKEFDVVAKDKSGNVKFLGMICSNKSKNIPQVSRKILLDAYFLREAIIYNNYNDVSIYIYMVDKDFFDEFNNKQLKYGPKEIVTQLIDITKEELKNKINKFHKEAERENIKHEY